MDKERAIPRDKRILLLNNDVAGSTE